MCFLLCVSSLVHVSVRVFISLSCVFFSLSNVCTLSIVSTVCTVHCFHLSRCSHCFVFSLCCVCCVCCVCVMYSGVKVVVVCCVLCSHRVQCVGVVISWEGVGCVLHVVIVCSGCCFVWIVSSGSVVLLLYVRVCSV